MDLFEEKRKIIDDAVKHLITGEDIYSDGNNKQPMKVSKVINKAIQLKSFEVDMALLMLTKIIKRKKGISTDRVVNLLMSDDIGKHLIRVLDTYNWAYHGFMSTTDLSIDKLYHLKKYSLTRYDLYTGFEVERDIDSFKIKMKKHENTDIPKCTDIDKICQKVLNLHERLYQGPMSDEEIEDGKKIIEEAIATNTIAMDVLVKDLFKDKAEFDSFVKETLYERLNLERGEE